MPQSSKRKEPIVLLIDADVLAYQAANGEQRVTDWGDDVVSVAMGTLEDGVADVMNAAEALKDKLGADRYILCLTHPEQFRKKLLPTYKANRGVKPLLVDPIREYLVAERGAVRRPHLEGDDVMGIYATHPKLIPGKKIIVSIDKDMAQIPGTLYNPGRDELREISVEEADYLHMRQTLTGDPTDNYKGCPGIGPVKADAILQRFPNHPEMRWPCVVQAYESRGLAEADALVQARVARILRHTDYDFQKKEPILWQPAK